MDVGCGELSFTQILKLINVPNTLLNYQRYN